MNNPTLIERLNTARVEVARLEREVESASCAEVGHRRKSIGGCCASCHLNSDCDCSVPVNECEVCGDCDYGDNAEAQEVRRNCTEKAMSEDPDYENRPCSVCGARTDDEAEGLCHQYQIPSGDYICHGHPEETSYPDGRLRFLSDIGAVKLDQWVNEQVAELAKEAQS